MESHDDLDDGYWMAELQCGTLNASLRFYEIGIGGLPKYFGGLAANWRGWRGEREWESLEGGVRLIATHDRLGTVSLTAELRTEAFAAHTAAKPRGPRTSPYPALATSAATRPSGVCSAASR